MLPTHVCVAGLVCAPSPQCSSPPVYFYPKDSPTRERYSLVLCVTNLGKQGNISVQHLPQKITGSYQFWGYKALLFQGPYVLACSLLIFGLFVSLVCETSMCVSVLCTSSLCRDIQGWSCFFSITEQQFGAIHVILSLGEWSKIMENRATS